jgi:outer membrane biosynthesis protein TonB
MRRQSDDARFHRSLAGSFAMALLLGLVIPWIDIPIPERDQLIEVPERLAQFIRKEQPRPIPKAAPIPEERKVEVPPEPKKPVPEVVPPEVTPETRIAEVAEPASKPETPRESVASKGLLAFRETFSNMASGQPSARLGAKARISNAGDTATGYAQRSMISTNGPGSSGGINLASLSRDVGSGGAGGQMEGVSVTRAESAIGGTGGDDRPLSSGAAAGRTDEEIQIVFDRYKAALYRLYNRELRKDPTLRGQMVLRLTIEPDGSVSLCNMQSSDMQAPMLAQQVVDRILGFDFGAKDVPSVTIIYPIDFLPTA